MTLPEPTYITVDEVKANTLITALQSLDDESITKIIQLAEGHIDAFCGPQPHHQYDDNLNRVFPREQDFSVVGGSSGFTEYPDRPEIPHNVGVACLRQVEWLYTQWWSDRATEQPSVDYPVEARQIGGDGSYSETLARGGMALSEATLCEQARVLLQGFKAGTAPLSLTKPDHVISRP